MLSSTTSGKKITKSKRQGHFNQVSLIDKRNASHKKNFKTVRDRNTVADIVEVRTDGDDDDEDGKSEEVRSENEDEDAEGGGGERTQQQKRRQDRSFYFTTERTVKRIRFNLGYVFPIPLALSVIINNLLHLGIAKVGHDDGIFKKVVDNGPNVPMEH